MNTLKGFPMLLFAAGLTLFLTGSAWAVPITLKEVFLGGKTDGNYFAMAEKSIARNVHGTGNAARFNFDLTGSGGTGQLQLGNRRVGAMVMPTNDETDYDLFLYATPYLAYIDFFISDWLFEYEDRSRERVKINIASGAITTSKTYRLEDDRDGSKRARIDLLSEGMLDLLMDGQLVAMAIAPAFQGVYNTFNLDRVVLYAEANETAPVPEPATMILMGAGLAGFAVHRRRRRMQNK